jgi:DNA-directed RNA polymerase specialized sigma24 family protein
MYSKFQNSTVHRHTRQDKSGTWRFYYEIEDSDGRTFERDERRPAVALAALIDVVDLDVDNKQEGFVPVEVAVEGQPAIATYLVGVHEYSAKQAGEAMGVEIETIEKYLSRFKPHTDA